MSYADYRTGGGRRPVPPRDPAAFDSFAGAGQQARSSRSSSQNYQDSRTSPPVSPPVQAPQPPVSNASMFATTNARPVENPYATGAYASSRGGPGAGGPSEAGNGTGGGGPEFYVSARQKGNRQGKIKDQIKNTMAAAKQDNWKVVCSKATNHDIAPPKGKHVRVIMQGLQWGGSITNRESPAGGIFYHLRKRMMKPEWVVAVKAQTIFHHIFREGNEKFVEYIAANARGIYKMEFFGDASADGYAHTGFIKSYGAYIEQWLAMKAAIKFPVGKSREDDPTSTARYRESNIEELLAALPLLMDTLTAMFTIELAGQIKYSAVATPSFSMITRDLTLIWVALSEGMIRLLDLFFTLEIPMATIALDVYKRFVEIVSKAQPFFDLAKSLNVKFKSPQLGSISLELLESMRQYLEIGPQDPNAAQNFSDEEVYEREPVVEPEPDHYYEPEPEYYSEEEPEIEQRPPTPSSSSSEEYESESESSSSEEEPEELPTAPAPAPPPPPKQFDPLADLLGITNGVGPANGAQPTQTNQVAVYMGGPQGLVQRAALDNTVDDRVANVKGMMAAGGPARNGQAAGAQRSGFGVDGSNMQIAMYGQQTPQQQQQMYAAAMQQQQQQQMAAYQTMAAYQSMAMYQSMAGMQPGMAQGMGGNPAMQQQQQFAAAAMAQQQQQQQMRGVMPGAAYMPVGQGNAAVPAMRPEAMGQQAGAYRVQKGTAKTRVSDSDAAFGPLLDQMKKTSLGK